MLVKNIKEMIIYESPDGGKTIYARDMQGNRELVKVDPRKEEQTRWFLWREILEASKDNPALANAISTAETIYGLTK